MNIDKTKIKLKHVFKNVYNMNSELYPNINKAIILQFFVGKTLPNLSPLDIHSSLKLKILYVGIAITTFICSNVIDHPE